MIFHKHSWFKVAVTYTDAAGCNVDPAQGLALIQALTDSAYDQTHVTQQCQGCKELRQFHLRGHVDQDTIK
jgi:hypothetical protein